MFTSRFVIGLDFGTRSARALLLRYGRAEVQASAVHAYRHGVMDRLPGQRPLPAGWALQNPDDYLLAAEDVLARVIGQLPTGGEVAGIGVAFTSSTPLPALMDGTPLSRLAPAEPHAYAKLWKHIAAQPYVGAFNAPGAHLAHTGGRSSSEWLPAKAAQFAAEAPQLWDRAERFIEAGDWLTWQLTGTERRSLSHAGYKAHYRGGYPAVVQDVLGPRLARPEAPGRAVGPLSEAWRVRLGLANHPVVAVSAIDAHAAALGAGVTAPGSLAAVLGTSGCYMLSDAAERHVPGIAGVVNGGIVPGLYGYEAGQAAFGDVLAWFVRQFPCGPDDAASFAAHDRAAGALSPGQSGLLALDWWNGCRTPLDRGDLTGAVLGFTPATTPAELYRALLEGLGFGARRIVDVYQQAGLPVQRVVLTGGIAERDSLLRGLLGEVLGRPVEVSTAEFASARGAAIHAALASGLCAGVPEAVALFADACTRPLDFDRAAHATYTELYEAYLEVGQFMAGSRVPATLRRLAGAGLERQAVL